MWTLLLSRASDPPGVYFDRRHVDGGEVKIGRSAAMCDIALPDDQGVVSRVHATMVAAGLELYVIDAGSKNGVALNDPASRIVPNSPVAVRANDRVMIGDFVVTIATEAAGAGVGLVAAPPPPLPAAAAPAQADRWFDAPADPLWDESPRGGDMHDFLSGAIHDMLAPPWKEETPAMPPDFGMGDLIGQAFSRPILADPLPMPDDFGIPEDWAIGPVSAPPAPPPAAAPPPQPAGAPPADDPFGPLPAGGGFGAPIGDDPFAMPPPSAAASFADDPFDLSTPLAAAQPASPMQPPPAAPPPPPPRAAAAPAGVDAAWAAFYEGAGLSPDELRLAPDAMRRLGVLYRQVVLGLSDIMQDRAAFKDEFRVERTQISIGRNNPLKHLPPLDAAKVLLGDPLPGFMDSEDAIRTAFEDVKKHQLAMLAGVQRALVAVFDRLSPPEIEKMIQKASGQKRALSFMRGVDRWSVYLTVFEALRRDATSNANGVMSAAFREGYEGFLKAAR